MIRRLYNLEDWLFYWSRTCAPPMRRKIETWSQRIGQFADRLDAQPWRSRAT